MLAYHADVLLFSSDKRLQMARAAADSNRVTCSRRSSFQQNPKGLPFVLQFLLDGGQVANLVHLSHMRANVNIV